MAVDTSVGNIKDIQAVATTSIVTDIQSLSPSALIELFILDMSKSTGDVNSLLYFHAGTNQLSGDIVWQGKTYIHLPIEAEGFSAGSNGGLPRPKIRLANLNGTFSQTLANYDDLIGCKIIRKKTFAKYLDAANFRKKNLLTYTEQLDASVWGIAGCVVGRDLIKAPDGSLTGDKLCETPSTLAAYHYVDFVGFPARGIVLNNLDTYTRSFYIKGAERTKVYIQIYSNPTTSTHIGVVFDTATGLFTSSYINGVALNHAFTATADVDGWWRVSQIYDLNTSDVDMYIRLMLVSTGVTTNYIGATGNGVYLWGNQLELGNLTDYVPSLPIFVSRASTATYIGSNGFIQSAAIDVPRYSYNSANLSAAPKLLTESAATNLLANSTAITNVVTNQIISPTGTLTGGLFTSVAGQFGGLIRFTYYTFSATAYTFSVYVKRGNCRYIGARIGNLLNGNLYATYDFDTNTCSLNGVAGVYLTAIVGKDGWVRLIFSGATTAGSSVIDLATVDATGNVTTNSLGAGQTAYIWGSQLETGYSATSYIPTTTISVPRNADVTTAEIGVNATANANQYYPDDVWYIDQKMSETRYMIEWELASAFDLVGVMLPSRQVNQNSCPWKYGGTECGYNQNTAGAKLFDSTDVAVASTAFDVCGKRLSSCEARFGTTKTVVLPYGGFPGALQYG